MIKTIKKMLVFLTVGGLVLSGVTGCNNSTETSTAVTEESPATDRKDAKATTEERVKATTEDAEPTTESSAGTSTETASNTTDGNTSATGKSNTGSSTGNTNTGTSTGNTGTSNSGTTTGGNTSNTNSNTNSGNTNPPATEAPATEAPATEATTEATVAYYRDWDYICRRTNELLKQNFPGATIGTAPSFQTYPEFDGMSTPLPYDDETLAQGLYQCIANDLTGRGIYPGDTTPVTTGAYVQKIEDAGYGPHPNLRQITIIYYK